MNLDAYFARPIAHRGWHDLSMGSPENSPSAFRRACEAGFPIECDLQLSSDGVAMVIHDDLLDRTSLGNGRVSDQTADAIAATPLRDSGHDDRILRFSKLLELVGGRVPILAELKHQTDGRNAQLAAAAASDLRHHQGKVALISFDPDLLRHAKHFGFSGPAGIIVTRYDDGFSREHIAPFRRFALRHLLHFFSTKFDFIDCDRRHLRLPAVRFFRALGMPVCCWTVRSEVEALEALNHCDQITFEGYTPRTNPS